jgi:hypothetical protein
MLERYKSSLPKLTIFIFGPGQHNTNEYATRCFNKRCQIKSALDNQHDVFFPEEIHEMAKADGMDVSNVTVFESYLLNEEADIVVVIFCLNASGVQAELIAFSQHQECADKMYVFYDTTFYTRGDGRFWHVNDALDLIEGNNGKTESFMETEIDSCSLLTRVTKMVERRRRALSISHFKKYQGVS